MLRGVGSALFSLVVSLAGGTVFYLLHIPLPWTLGALSVAAVLSIHGRRWMLMPVAARIVARPVVGVIAGSAFTAHVIANSLGWWDAILAVLVGALAVTLLGNIFFRKIGKLDATTAFFASSPGGLGEMTLLGGMLGGDIRSLVLIHTIRIVLSVISVPIILQLWLGHPIGRTSPVSGGELLIPAPDLMLLALCCLAGVWLSRLTRFPAGMMIYTLVFSALLHVLGVVNAIMPGWVTILVQATVGAIAGSNFSGFRLSEISQMLVLAVTWAIVMIATAVGLAAVTSSIFDRQFEIMLLTLAPGGMVEMITITLALSIDVAFVVTCQMWRLLLIMTIMPISFQWLKGRSAWF